MDAGTELGPYRLERELGSGGMGAVYAATGEAGVRVALKVVHPHLLERDGARERFLREAEIGRAVAHRNVVRTLDCGTDDGRLYLVMEYVEGQTLRALVDELGALPEELCRHVGREICRGLGAIHGVGAVHRDLKPANVLITPEHEVKVMDLGVARLIDASVQLSRSGAFVGSLAYAAPEQFRGERAVLDGRTDLFALGTLLYELATGTQPFAGGEMPAVVNRVLNEEPRPVGELAPQVSPFLEEVVSRLLAKDADARFASADEVLGVLTAGEESPWWSARSIELRGETKKPLRRVRIPRDTVVHGRDGELEQLREAFDAAKSGNGGVLLIRGEAGIGKSRLVDEFAGRLEQAGEDLHFLFGSYPPGGAATAAGAWCEAYRAQLGSAGSKGHLQETPLLVPAFDALLRGEPAPDGGIALTRSTLQTCFVRTTQSLAAERPTIVVIDDLHFAPDEGRALFTSLAHAVPGHRVLLVGTARPGIPGDWLAETARLDQVRALEVERLGAGDLETLLTEALRSAPLAVEVAPRLLEKTDGNPYFLFEVLRVLREGGRLTRTDAGWTISDRLDEIEIPPTVRDLIRARASRLTQEERDLLDVAACWGFEFEPALVGEAVGMARIPVLRALSRIERAHGLVRSRGGAHVFDHHQVQETLYGGLPDGLRREYHSALADALLRRHAGDTEAPLSGAAAVALCRNCLLAARAADAVPHLPPAVEHLERAGRLADAVDLARLALDAPGVLTGRERAEILLVLCRVHGPLVKLGRWSEARTLSEEGEALGRDAGDGRLECEFANCVGTALLRMGRPDDAEAAIRRSLALAPRHSDAVRAEAIAVGNLGILRVSQRRFPEAAELLGRQLAAARAGGDGRTESAALVNLGVVAFEEGRMEDARRHFERSLAAARACGFGAAQMNCLRSLGGVAGMSGRLLDGLRLLEESLDLARSRGIRAEIVASLQHAGVMLRLLGRSDASRSHLGHALSLRRELADRAGAALCLGLIGFVHLDEGDAAGAERSFRSALRECEGVGARDAEVNARVGLGVVRLDRGDTAAAEEILASAATTGGDEPGGAVLAACLLATLRPERLAAASEALERRASSMGLHERCYARLLLWRAGGDVGQLAAAKEELDGSADTLPPDDRARMLENVRAHRELVAEWEAHGARGTR